MQNSDNDTSKNDAEHKSAKQNSLEENQQANEEVGALPETPDTGAPAEAPIAGSEPVADTVDDKVEETAEAVPTEETVAETAEAIATEETVAETAEATTEEAVEETAEKTAEKTAEASATAAVAEQTVPVVAEPPVEADVEPEQNMEAPPAPKPPKVAFSEFDLQPALAKAIEKMGFTHCTPIQAQSLRYTLRGYDVTGKAQTGTGKTAAFLITLINDMLTNPIQEQRYAGEPRAIVLAPTRELVIQIASDADLLCHGSGLNVITLVGGEDYAKQLKAVDKGPVDIVVATPGRLIDFLQHEHLYLGMVELLVIDEADRMLDMGFIPQVRNIVARTPHKDCRQTLLFSATFTPEIIELTSRWAMDPVMIEIEPERVATDTVEQIVYLVTTEDKYKLLYNLVSLQGSEKVIVFSNRRDQVRKLADNLYRNGIDCGMLSGEVAQKKRIKTLEDFRTGTTKVLVATDVAGRGLHIDDVTHVINYTLPEEAEDYVHRIGRTGRAGADGTSISFACEEDSFLLPNIEDKLGEKLPCVHPDQRLLADPPEFSRASHFKDDDKSGKSGRSGKGGGARNRSGSRSRSRRS